MRTAAVVIAAASEPTPGSVDASAVSGGVGEQSGASHRCCCSGVPTSTTGRAKNPPDVTRFPIPAQPQFSSSWTMQPVRTSATPPPPTSSGSMNDVSPTSAARWTIVDGAVGVALVDLGRDGPDLGAGELGGERLDLALLVGQIGGR